MPKNYGPPLSSKRGHLWWAEEYYSLCSAHHIPVTGCPRCAAGNWVNVWGQRVSSFVYRNSPGLWRWWANRPESASKNFLEKHFPGLRSSKPNTWKGQALRYAYWIWTWKKWWK